MPTFHISLDGQTIAAVNTEGYHVLTMHINGSRDSEQLATLDVSGGRYERDMPPVSLTWVSDIPLLANQLVAISMDGQGATSHAGKTIAELFPDEPVGDATEPRITDFTLSAEQMEEIRRRPVFHDKFAFEFKSSRGTDVAVQTAPEEDFFSFSVLWNWMEAEAYVAVRSSTLDNLEARQPGRSHARERLAVGDHLSFQMK